MKLRLIKEKFEYPNSENIHKIVNEIYEAISGFDLIALKDDKVLDSKVKTLKKTLQSIENHVERKYR